MQCRKLFYYSFDSLYCTMVLIGLATPREKYTYLGNLSTHISKPLFDILTQICSKWDIRSIFSVYNHLLANLLLLIADIRYAVRHTIWRKIRLKRLRPQKLHRPNWEHSEIGAETPDFYGLPRIKTMTHVCPVLSQPSPSHCKGFLSSKPFFYGPTKLQ